MNRIVNAIANGIPVSFQFWVVRNIIITLFAILCIYLNADSVHPSSSNYLFVGMAIIAIFVAWKK